MRKIVFQAHADTVGTDTAELVCFEVDANGNEVTDAFLDMYAQDFGQEHWNTFEPNTGGDDDDYQDPDEYYDACGAWWEEYNPAEHNGVIDSGADGYEED